MKNHIIAYLRQIVFILLCFNISIVSGKDSELRFRTIYTDNGLSNNIITAIAQDAETSQVLMVAYMNRQALDLTIKTGLATYYSRSRQKLWKKGEESGHMQKVRQILADCDQDCREPDAACHP